MTGLLYAIEAESFFTEMRLPTLMVSLPPTINDKYGLQMGLNQQKLVTAFNIHHFMMHLLRGDSYMSKNMSLLADLDSQTSC